MINDPLADLGLDIADAGAACTEAPVEGAAEAGEATAPVAAKASREQVEIGELEFDTVDFIPTAKRGGPSGSKYEFDKLVAPVLKDENDPSKGWRYHTFTAKLQEGVDADKLKRSVQSATTAANRAAKAEGSVNRYATRALIKDGEFKGVTVFRVDNTVDEEEAAS